MKVILENDNYKTIEINCEANKMGVPQKRMRVFLIAWNNNKEFHLSIKEKNGGVLGDVLQNVNNSLNHNPKILKPGSIDFKIAQHIKQGQKLSNVRQGRNYVHTWNMPEIFGATTEEEQKILNMMIILRRRNRKRKNGDADPVSKEVINNSLDNFSDSMLTSLVTKGFLRKIGDAYDLSRTFNGKYRRLHLREPSPTVDTRFGEPRYFIHPIEDRGFSVREAARIQGFSDNFVFYGPDKIQYRHVGNAVPPPLARVLAKIIKEIILL